MHSRIVLVALVIWAAPVAAVLTRVPVLDTWEEYAYGGKEPFRFRWVWETTWPDRSTDAPLGVSRGRDARAINWWLLSLELLGVSLIGGTGVFATYWSSLRRAATEADAIPDAY